jgi:triosephosphate isomerase
MTVGESTDCLGRLLRPTAGTRRVILSPPFTALHAMSESLEDVPIRLGAQTLSVASGGARNGEVSARLARDAGGR